MGETTEIWDGEIMLMDVFAPFKGFLKTVKFKLGFSLFSYVLVWENNLVRKSA